MVRGEVTNATPGGAGVGGLTVVLHRESATTHSHLETVTGADGRFQFDGIVYDSTVAYGLSVRFQGGMYGIDLDLSNGSPSPVFLTVYDGATDDEMLRASTASVLFARADKSNQEITAFEIIRLVNDSDRAYVPGPRPMDLVRIGLPPDARGLGVDTRLPGADFIQVDRGFALVASVPPGEHEVTYTYRFPYAGSGVSFTRSFKYGAESLRVLAADEAMRLSSEELGDAELVDIGGRSYQLIQASELPRGAEISIRIEGLPRESVWERLGQRLDSVRFEYAAPVALGLFMVILVAFAMRRRRRVTSDSS